MITIERNVCRIYDSWLESARSENTKRSYQRIIPEFFEMVLGKSIDDLEEKDFSIFIPIEIRERYIQVLQERGVKNSTVRNYLSVVISFLTKLDRNRIFKTVDFKYIINEVLAEDNLKDDTKNRTLMTEDAYEDFHEWLINRKFSARYGDLGMRYATVLDLMFSTAIRIDAVFNNLKWDNIVYESDSKRNSGWTIYVLDKGEKNNRKPISEDLRDKLYAQKVEGSELVFEGLSKQSFTRLTKEFGKLVGVDYTPHSIKVGAGTKLYQMTNDLVLTSRFLDHADTKTTLRYIRTDYDRMQSGSYLMSTEFDLSDIDKLSEAELREIIRNRKDIAMSIIVEANK